MSFLPQIFKGASSSKRIGCCRNISRDFRQSPLTSFSVIWTVFPGRLPLTAMWSKMINNPNNRSSFNIFDSTTNLAMCIWSITYLRGAFVWCYRCWFHLPPWLRQSIRSPDDDAGCSTVYICKRRRLGPLFNAEKVLNGFEEFATAEGLPSVLN